jgi:D-arabinose 1-dehydrogenase-like Zn-dependent alcohol dehydrogenase
METTMLSYPFDEFGKPLARVLRETPQPSGSEVVVRVGSCGLCHSDVHLHEGYFDLGNGQKLDLSRGIAPPRVLGHEIAGTVAAVGPDAGGVAVGDRRVVFPWIGCTACGPCKNGHEELCMAPRALGINRDGGFADHVLVPHPRYLFPYDPLPEAEACTYACSGLTAFGALKKCAPLVAGDALLIIGAGGVGLSGVRMAAAALGVKPVVAEIDRGKWDLARDAGAADCLDPTDAAATKAFMKASGGAAAAIDFVGAAATFSYGLAALRKGGKLVCVGLFGGSAPVTTAMLPLRAVTITGSYVGSLAEMAELMALARKGGLPAMPVTPRPLAEVNEALEALGSGAIRGRAVLQP